MGGLLLVGLLAAACAAPAATPTGGAATPYGGRCGSRGGLPDPLCTPGETDARVTPGNVQSTICRRGYAASVRPPKEVSYRIKLRVTQAYGLAHVPFAALELDHLVPLSLGGASTERNLWPEQRSGVSNAADKDVLEIRLHADVCRGRLGLRAAQRAIAVDWRTAG